MGTRWVYDGVGDPVYAAALARAILGHTGQAEELVEGVARRAPSMAIASTAPEDAEVPEIGGIVRVDGTDPAVIVTATVELTVAPQARRRTAGRRPDRHLAGTGDTGAAGLGAVDTLVRQDETGSPAGPLTAIVHGCASLE